MLLNIVKEISFPQKQSSVFTFSRNPAIQFSEKYANVCPWRLTGHFTQTEQNIKEKPTQRAKDVDKSEYRNVCLSVVWC